MRVLAFVFGLALFGIAIAVWSKGPEGEIAAALLALIYWRICGWCVR